jgi:hypothetical protein
MKSLTESTIELASTFRGTRPTMSYLLLKARLYLRATGTPKPSQRMVWTLADAVDNLLREEALNV